MTRKCHNQIRQTNPWHDQEDKKNPQATRNSEHTNVPSYLFPSEMIAKLERAKCYCKTKQVSNNKPPQTIGATTNKE